MGNLPRHRVHDQVLHQGEMFSCPFARFNSRVCKVITEADFAWKGGEAWTEQELATIIVCPNGHASVRKVSQIRPSTLGLLNQNSLADRNTGLIRDGLYHRDVLM